MKKIIVTALLVGAVLAGPVHAEDSCSISACHHSLKGLKVMHPPVAEVRCLECHTQTANHPLDRTGTVRLVEPQPGLCYRCHSRLGQKKTVHSPVRQGTCTACHNPHGATGRFFIDLDEGQMKFCTKCHDPGIFQRKNVHPPVAEGKCSVCHEHHQSDAPGLIREKVPKLCLTCHPEVMKKLDSAAVVHPPVKEGRCLGCHDPHSSASRYLLKGNPGIFCTACHAKIQKTIAAAKFGHAPVEQPGSCLTCHSGHSSVGKALLPSEERKFCVGCHTGVASSLEDKLLLHGPLREGKCTPCHDPHGSAARNLLKGNYPDDLYQPYDKSKNQYSFCLKCHQKNLLLFADTSVYTKFRDGKNNLHFVHVSNRKKGRTCRLCHEHHGSDTDHLLRNKGMEFGEWRVPLRFEGNASGGSCSPGCHGTFSYQRKTRSP